MHSWALGCGTYSPCCPKGKVKGNSCLCCRRRLFLLDGRKLQGSYSFVKSQQDAEKFRECRRVIIQSKILEVCLKFTAL